MRINTGLLILLLFLFLLLTIPSLKRQSGGASFTFSAINSPQMEGIPTLAGIPNPANPKRPVMRLDKDVITYYGHGLPLTPVKPGPIVGPLKIAHNSGIATLPECCPSPYSSDNGCLCGAIENLK